MTDLSVRQDKIKAKRASTPFRDFIKELASWYPLVYYRSNGMISRYPENEIIKKQVTSAEFEAKRTLIIEEEMIGAVFENMRRLIGMIPFENLKQMGDNENCSYNDIVLYAKNSYLSSVVIESENVMYSMCTIGSNNVYNSVMTWSGCDNVFSSRFTINSYNVFYSSYTQDSSNIWFCANMIGCQECLFCHGLENKSYCIQNKEYPKEEYFEQKAAWLSQKEHFATWHATVVEFKGKNIGENIKGSFNIKGTNLDNVYYTLQLTNARNVIIGGGGYDMENFIDTVSVGSRNEKDMCGVMGAGYNASNLYCCYETSVDTSNMYYCYYCESCSFCFGCVGLKNKQFCLYNKEYEKDEWHEKVNNIFGKMENDGTLGKFFPGTLCPFNFNDTVAYLIDDSFNKDEVEKDGFMWRDDEIKVDIPDGIKTIKTSDLNQYQGFDKDGEWEIDSDLLEKVIVDEKGNYYRIMPMELEFLRKYELPIPEIHWLERIKLGFKFN